MKMKVLIACEYSGKVRDAFINAGHDAISCDLLEGEGQHWERHYMGDISDLFSSDNTIKQAFGIKGSFDLLIAFPPCTHLAVSGARYFEAKRKDGRQQEGIDFFMKLINAPINKICVENPVGIMSTQHRKPNQIIQPYDYGHDASKKTCLWLKNLPKLQSTSIVPGKLVNGKTLWANQTPSGQNKLGPSEDRWKLRSTTYQGIADAMAQQWGTIK